MKFLKITTYLEKNVFSFLPNEDNRIPSSLSTFSSFSVNPLCIYFFPQAKNPQPYPPLFHRVTDVDEFIQDVDSFCGKLSLPFVALYLLVEDNFV